MAIEVNQYSLASYYVDVMRNEIKLSNATCFFTKIDDQLYLITNWHVVSGQNADTLLSLSDTCAIPNKLRVYLPKAKDNAIEYSNLHYVDVAIRDEDDNALWYEKRKDDRMIDVAVLPCNINEDFYYLPIEDAEEPFNEGVTCAIASEIYIIGFPFSDEYGYTPIWKKASVASEPEIDINGFPYFFADTATKQGMSGSPVVLFKDRPATILNQTEHKISHHFTKFIGIYSGRIGANSESRNDAQLGRVWKAQVIKEIIDESKGEIGE